MGTSGSNSPVILCLRAIRLDSLNKECKSAPVIPSSLESLATSSKLISGLKGGFVPFFCVKVIFNRYSKQLFEDLLYSKSLKSRSDLFLWENQRKEFYRNVPVLK